MNQKKLGMKAWRMLWGARPSELADLNVTELARRLDTTPANLSRAVSRTSYYTLGKHLELKKFQAFEVLVICYKIHSVKKALKIMGIESESHFIKRYKAHRGRTPGEFCRKKRKEWEEKKRNNDPEYLNWVKYHHYHLEFI